MARPPRRRYQPRPDYTRPLLQISPEERERIIAKLTVLYGELDASAYYWEVERLIQVHHAHKPPEMLREHLNRLKQQHRDLDAAITSLQLTGTADQLQLRRLKKQKLMLKDQIAGVEDQMLPDIIA